MRRICRLSDYSGGVVFLSLCYLVLRPILQPAAWRVRSNDLKEAGNRRAPARARHPSATTPPFGADVVRPALPRGRQPAPGARALAILHHHTRDTASLS